MSSPSRSDQPTLADADAMLSCIPAQGRETWVRAAMALHAEFGDEALPIWLEWSRTADNFRERDAIAVWRSLRPSGGINFATLVHVAREHGWRPDSDRRLPVVQRKAAPAPAPKAPPFLARLPVPEIHADGYQTMTHPEFGTPARWWRYESTEGELMFAVARFEGPEGKAIRPASFGTDGTRPTGWRWKRPHVLIPWNLPEIYARPDAPIVVSEGEKAASAAGALLPRYVSTCGHGGASQAHLTHWGHLARRDVLILPDDDAASVEQWAPTLARILFDLGARVRIVDPSKLWEGAR